MDYSKFEQLKDVHFLSKYEPEETRYARYAVSHPSILATGHKVVDAYQALCRARGMLYYAYADNWGDLSGSEDVSRLFAKSQMVIAAVLEYSICMDMSWQVIWASFQPTSLDLLLRGRYKEMEALCTGTAVHEQLNCTMAIHGVGAELARDIKALLVDNENRSVVKEMRELYNFIKHRGTIHIKGLGDNDKALFYTVEGKTIPKQSRLSYGVDELVDMLLDYDEAISEYIATLAGKLIPTHYLETKCNFEDVLGSALIISGVLPEIH